MMQHVMTYYQLNTGRIATIGYDTIEEIYVVTRFDKSEKAYDIQEYSYLGPARDWLESLCYDLLYSPAQSNLQPAGDQS